MFMNNVCGQTPGWGEGKQLEGRGGGERGEAAAAEPDELHVGGIWQAARSFVIIPKF